MRRSSFLRRPDGSRPKLISVKDVMRFERAVLESAIQRDSA